MGQEDIIRYLKKNKRVISIKEFQEQSWYNSMFYYQLESLEKGGFIERIKVGGKSCVKMK